MKVSHFPFVLDENFNDLYLDKSKIIGDFEVLHIFSRVTALECLESAMQFALSKEWFLIKNNCF